MYQYFKRQLKSPTCFESFVIHPQGSIERASLKLLVMFCVRSRCLAAWNLDVWCACLVRRVAPDTHVVPRCRSPNPCLPQQQDTICCKNLSLTLLKMGKRTWHYVYCARSAMLPLSKPLPTTTTGYYTIFCKNLSLTLLKMGKRTWHYVYCARSATLPLSEYLPTTTTGHYTVCCKNLSLTLL